MKKNAIEFTKKNQSVSYLVFLNETGAFVGYFTIALKPITIKVEKVSNVVKRKLQRVAKQDDGDGSYVASAILIAQLGKNYTNGLNQHISGKELLEIAWEVVMRIQYAAGGVIAFLEAEKNEKLIRFYENNGFRMFDHREIQTHTENAHELLQLFRLI